MLPILAWAAAAVAGCGDGNPTPGPPSSSSRVIEIDIDDHGLAGLWMANAPNLKGLIARGTLAYSRVVVPTHSNQNNIALLTGQYADGNNVPANSWLGRDRNLAPPFSLQGLELGDYATYSKNPLLVRGDSVYLAAGRAGAKSAYFGELPAFEVGADDVHLTIVGLMFGTLTVTADLGRSLLTSTAGLGYPPTLVNTYHFDGPPVAAETFTHFTLHDAAAFVRKTSPATPMPGYMFVWDFLALDGNPTDVSGADGPSLIAAVEDYDAALGDLLAALTEKGLLDGTNILFTLDHGKVNATQQVVLGSRDGSNPTKPADGQLAAAVAAMGPALGITTTDYAILNEDGDAQLYARVPGAGTAAGAARQGEVTHALLQIIQSGVIVGLDTTRTMTADGALGTRRFQDFRVSGPNQADIVVFPADEWTLNQVDGTNAVPGPFVEHAQFPYGRHGGFSPDELYVPLIMAGPAFKKGVLLPHPVEHPQVASTAMWPLGRARMTTAAWGPISPALLGDTGEAIPLPDPLPTTRELVLAQSGYAGTPVLVGPPAPSAVIIDAAGLYEDELFNDPMLADFAAPLRQLAEQGARLEDFWTQSRDWPVTEYQLLAGGSPTFDRAAVVPAEGDPTMPATPSLGLLQMPPVAGFVANQAGYDGWRVPEVYPGGSLFAAAKAQGLTTAVLGAPDFHALHIDPGAIDLTALGDDSATLQALRDLLAAHPRTLALVGMGGARTGDRHAAAAQNELSTLGASITALVDAATTAGAIVFVTSRGATTIDDPAADFYGPGTSRHVPLLILGPNARTGVVSGQPGAPADLPATVLFALGVPSTTDFVTGTWATGPTVGGIAQPLPASATAGHALVRAFTFVAGVAAP